MNCSMLWFGNDLAEMYDCNQAQHPVGSTLMHVVMLALH